MATSDEFNDPDHVVLKMAREEAVALGHPYLGTEHLLLALLRGNDTDIIRVLNEVGITTDAVRAALLETLPAGEAGGTSPAGELPYTSRTKQVLRFAATESRAAGSSVATGLHFLQGMLWEDRNIAAQVLYRLGMPRPEG